MKEIVFVWSFKLCQEKKKEKSDDIGIESLKNRFLDDRLSQRHSMSSFYHDPYTNDTRVK